MESREGGVRGRAQSSSSAFPTPCEQLSQQAPEKRCLFLKLLLWILIYLNFPWKVCLLSNDISNSPQTASQIKAWDIKSTWTDYVWGSSVIYVSGHIWVMKVSTFDTFNTAPPGKWGEHSLVRDCMGLSELTSTHKPVDLGWHLPAPSSLGTA